MAIDALLAELGRDATDERDAILADATARAERLRQDAAREVERHRAEWLAPRERELERRAAQDVAAARRRARDRVLTARQDALATVLDAARAQLAERGAAAAYRERVGAHLHEALAYVGDAPVVVRVRPDLAKAARAALHGRDATVETTTDLDAGVVVETADRSVLVDNTLPARLERLMPEIAVAVARALEEDLR